MRVPETLSTAFGQPFQDLLSEFLRADGLLAGDEDLSARRFLTRSVVPHVEKLSSLFNRLDASADCTELQRYWKNSSNPTNFRLAYFLSFMPPNLYRIAGIWAELARLGYRWKGGPLLRAIDFGAGPATATCGVAAGEKYSPLGLPEHGNWALIEQDKAVLKMGMDWTALYLPFLDSSEKKTDWEMRPFHRTLEFDRPLLPRGAPRFNLWMMSFFLNEATSPDASQALAEKLLDAWENHLEDEALIVLVEPALKMFSRRLLTLRQNLLQEAERRGTIPLQILTPCLGHQACGALAKPDDWCHEEVMWWRPPYLRVLDELTKLDRKSLPFSYLVLTKSSRKREELLPVIGGFNSAKRERLVSPVHWGGPNQEFYVCGERGKRRGRYKSKAKERDEAAAGPPSDLGADADTLELQRGSILLDYDQDVIGRDLEIKKLRLKV